MKGTRTENEQGWHINSNLVTHMYIYTKVLVRDTTEESKMRVDDFFPFSPQFILMADEFPGEDFKRYEKSVSSQDPASVVDRKADIGEMFLRKGSVRLSGVVAIKMSIAEGDPERSELPVGEA